MVDGKPNPIFTLVTSVIASISQSERETLLYRAKQGLDAYVAKGVKLGRPKNSNENDKVFLSKHNDIVKELEAGQSIRRISKITGKSTSTIQKVKKLV